VQQHAERRSQELPPLFR